MRIALVVALLADGLILWASAGTAACWVRSLAVGIALVLALLADGLVLWAAAGTAACWVCSSRLRNDNGLIRRRFAPAKADSNFASGNPRSTTCFAASWRLRTRSSTPFFTSLKGTAACWVCSLRFGIALLGRLLVDELVVWASA